MTKDPTFLQRKVRGIFPRALFLSLSGVVLALGAFAVTIIEREEKMLLSNLAARAELLAASVDRVTAAAIVEEDYTTVVLQYTKMVESRPEIRYAVVSNGREGTSNLFVKKAGSDSAVWTFGTLEGGFWNPENREQKARIEFSDLCNEQVLHYWYPFAYSGIDWGWIHVGIALDDYYSNTKSLYRIVVLLAVPGLLIGIGMSFTFAKQLTLPISKLQRFAQRVASGDLSQRVEFRSNDEIGDLADSMNKMTYELALSVQKEAELREKDILLKEIHHRVKNNMQILSSLLRLQARKVPSDEMKQVLQESETRIRSMGLIHEKLYQTESLSDIDFNGYVKTLVQELQRMYRERAAAVQLKIEMEDARLGLDTALPCGLIINELVSNSLKYGFPDGQEGCILIAMHSSSEGGLILEIADDGIGAESSEELTREGSLGSRLVNMLVEQLNGEMAVDTKPNQGVVIKIRFQEALYRERI